MQHIVFDMELNQAVIKEKIIQSPLFLHGEIVQIGAVKLDADFNLVDQMKLDVRPAYYTRMNSRVRRLTGISNQKLKEGLPFVEALEQFRQWCGQGGIFDFITWGTDDMPILRENMQLYGHDPDWLPFCYDLQRIYDAQVARENRQWALSAALEKLELAPIGQAHDALDDALNTAQVCRALDMARGISEYTEPVRREKRPRRDRPGVDLEACGELLEEAKGRPFYCPACGQALFAGEWQDRGQGRFLAETACPAHGEYLLKLRLQNGEEGAFILTRTLRTMDQEGRAQMEAVPAQRKKRRRRRR